MEASVLGHPGQRTRLRVKLRAQELSMNLEGLPSPGGIFFDASGFFSFLNTSLI